MVKIFPALEPNKPKEPSQSELFSFLRFCHYAFLKYSRNTDEKALDQDATS